MVSLYGDNGEDGLQNDLQPQLSESQPSIETQIRANLPVRHLLTLEQIAEQHGCAVEQVPDNFLIVTEKLEDQIHQHPDVDYRDAIEIVDPVFQMWNATRFLPTNHSLGTFSRSLDTYDAFIAAYFPEHDPEFNRRLLRNIKLFNQTAISLHRLRYIRNKAQPPREGYVPRYTNADTWISVGKIPQSESHFVTTAEVLREVDELTKTYDFPALLFHATGSDALPSISHEGSILSSREAIKRGIPIRTGEFLEQIQPLSSDQTYGLSDIHVSPQLISSYAIMRWFDEFDVAFGVTPDAVKAHHQKRTGQNPLLQDFGEGIPIGPEFPLTEVHCIFAPQLRRETMMEWIRRFAPHIRFISTEAWALIKTYGTDYFSRLPRYDPVTIVDTVSKTNNAVIVTCSQS